MFELIDYKPEHAREVDGIGSKEKGVGGSILPGDWAELLSKSLVAKTGVFDGRVIGCGGLFEIWPGVAEAWVTFVSDVGNLHIDPSIVKSQLHKWMKDFNLARVHAPLRADWEIGIKYAQWLGFKPDGWPDVPNGVRMRKYHYDGTDAIMHSIIRER